MRLPTRSRSNFRHGSRPRHDFPITIRWAALVGFAARLMILDFGGGASLTRLLNQLRTFKWTRPMGRTNMAPPEPEPAVAIRDESVTM